MLCSQLKLKCLTWKLIFSKFVSIFSIKKPLPPKQVMCNQLLKKDRLINRPLIPKKPWTQNS